jgi:hypothetical protein
MVKAHCFLVFRGFEPEASSKKTCSPPPPPRLFLPDLLPGDLFKPKNYENKGPAAYYKKKTFFLSIYGVRTRSLLQKGVLAASSYQLVIYY